MEAPPLWPVKGCYLGCHLSETPDLGAEKGQLKSGRVKKVHVQILPLYLKEGADLPWQACRLVSKLC